eukprot:g14913.t1
MLAKLKRWWASRKAEHAARLRETDAAVLWPAIYDQVGGDPAEFLLTAAAHVVNDPAWTDHWLDRGLDTDPASPGNWLARRIMENRERGGEDPAELIELIRMASERIAEQEKRIHSLRLMLDQKTETWIGEETARARTAEARLDRMAEILGEVEATPGLSESPDLLQKWRPMPGITPPPGTLFEVLALPSKACSAGTSRLDAIENMRELLAQLAAQQSDPIAWFDGMVENLRGKTRDVLLERGPSIPLLEVLNRATTILHRRARSLWEDRDHLRHHAALALLALDDGCPERAVSVLRDAVHAAPQAIEELGAVIPDRDMVFVAAWLLTEGRITLDEVRRAAALGNSESERKHHDFVTGRDSGQVWAMSVATRAATDRVLACYRGYARPIPAQQVIRAVAGSGLAPICEGAIWQAIACVDEVPSGYFAAGFVEGCRELARSIATGMLFAAIMLMWQPPWWMWPAVPLVHVFLAALVYVVITPKMFRAKRGLEILPDLVDGRGGA